MPRRKVIEREMEKQDPLKIGGKQILVFKVGNDEFGLDISSVREVLRPQEVYPLPRAPDFIEGVISLRGHVIALIDLRKKLFHPYPFPSPSGGEGGGPKGKRIIICKVNRIILGLTVDGLKEIIPLSEENSRPMPELAAMQMETNVTAGLAKIGERIIPILDLAQLITKKEAAELSGLGR